MHYKTIVMELLEQAPELHNQLRQEHKLLAAVEALAVRLKAKHEEFTKLLEQAHPETESNDSSSRAMELAIQSLQTNLAQWSGQLASENLPELSFDQFMAQTAQHSSDE